MVSQQGGRFWAMFWGLFGVLWAGMITWYAVENFSGWWNWLLFAAIQVYQIIEGSSFSRFAASMIIWGISIQELRVVHAVRWQEKIRRRPLSMAGRQKDPL